MRQFHSYDTNPGQYYGSVYTFYISGDGNDSRIVVVEQDRGPPNYRPGDWIEETFTNSYDVEEFLRIYGQRADIIEALQAVAGVWVKDGEGGKP